MRRFLGGGLLVVVLGGALLLAGCDFLEFIDDLFGRGGGIGGVNFVEIVAEYSFGIEVMNRDTGTLQPLALFASISSIGPLTFDAASSTYVAETPPGSDPYVRMSIQLDESGSKIWDLDVERRMTHDAGSWERIDRLVAYDIPYHRVEGDSTFYRIDVTLPQWIGLGRVEYRDWSTTLHSEQDPAFWVANPSDVQAYFDADPNRYIEIEFRQ